MIKSLLHEQVLKLRLKTGFSGSIVVWAVIAVVALIFAFIFGLVAAFEWLTFLCGPIYAGLIIAGVFLLVAILALIALGLTRRSIRKKAQAELTLSAAARQHSMVSWMDPSMLAVGIQVMRSVGLKRFVPLAAVGFVAASLGREWARSHRAERSAEK